MAFDISRLTSAVNKYLNSISDVAGAAKKASEEIEARTQFATDLKDAIRQNIEARSREEVSVPDIASLVREQVTSATGSIDSQIQQINGQFISANLIQSSLFNGLEDANKTDTNSTLQALGLDAATGSSALNDALSRIVSQNEVKTSVETVAEDSEKSGSSSELAKALIKAYKTSGSSVPITSIFGDFSI